jgi:hypothetical protein
MSSLLHQCLQPFPSWAQASAVLVTYAAYSVAYTFMIAKNRRDRSYGVPLLCLASNISWEIQTTLVIQSNYACYSLANGTWLAMNMIIMAQTFYYGPTEWRRSTPWLRTIGASWFHALFAMVSACTYIFWQLFMQQTGDDANDAAYSSWVMALLEAVLTLAMLHQRQSSRGQSVLAACFKTVSVTAAATISILVSPKPNGADLSTPLFMYVYALVIVLNAMYAVMLRAQQRREQRGAAHAAAPHAGRGKGE